MQAAREGRGLRLSPSEVAELALDDAISYRASADDNGDD